MSARTIGEDLAYAAARRPDHPAVLTGSGSLTFAELDAAATRLACGIRGRGVERGDRVVTLLPNGLEMAIAVYGILRSGAALTPLHPSMKREKLARVLAESAASLVVTDADRAETARAAAATAGAVSVAADVNELGAAGEPPAPQLSLDLAAVIYTSGSTGEPNGVTLTHANMTFVADSIIEYLEHGEDERVLCVLPLSFGYGLYQLLTCVRTASTIVLEPGVGLPGRLVQLLQEQAITVLPGVPTVFELLTSLPGLAERELPHLRTLTNAGAALPRTTLERTRQTFPRARLYSMYGQTECQRVCYLPPEQLDERPDSVGIPIPGTDAWIEADDGHRVDPGEVGELIVRGAHVMQGYWGKPEATAQKLRPGRWPWERVLATGDLFKADEDGYLYFVSRRDDVIKSRGEKVVPREVEDVLRGAPAVREAAVVGVPDRLLGEAVYAHVTVEPGGAFDERAVLRHCAGHLEDYMVPKRVIAHDELPKTANGKLDRRALADLGAA